MPREGVGAVTKTGAGDTKRARDKDGNKNKDSDRGGVRDRDM